jgi:glycosyltransferase involved in cell wall biosynthesis
LLGKPYFGIPEHRFAILYFFDLRSYTSRKNPWAVIEAFHRLIQARPNAEVQLVLKLNYSRTDPGVVLQIKQRIAAFAGRVTMIDATLSNNETKNLVRCCDCFLSLHRSEGFGRGGAEAMFFAKPVVATGWSGNMDYMNDEVAFPVSYTLVPVHEGEYPEFQGQVWANPNIGEAASVLVKLVDDPAYARNIGARARTHMQQQFSDAALGARYRERLRSIAGNAANHARIYAKATPVTSWIKLQSFARAGIAYFSTIAPV